MVNTKRDRTDTGRTEIGRRDPGGGGWARDGSGGANDTVAVRASGYRCPGGRPTIGMTGERTGTRNRRKYRDHRASTDQGAEPP